MPLDQLCYNHQREGPPIRDMGLYSFSDGFRDDRYGTSYSTKTTEPKCKDNKKWQRRQSGTVRSVPAQTPFVLVRRWEGGKEAQNKTTLVIL